MGGFYRSPNSNEAYFELSESTDRAYNTNIIDIFILNYNLAMVDVNKMTDLIRIKRNAVTYKIQII